MSLGNNPQTLEDGTTISHKGDCFFIEKPNGTAALYKLTVNYEGRENSEYGTTVESLGHFKGGKHIGTNDNDMTVTDTALVKAYFEKLEPEQKENVKQDRTKDAAEIKAGLKPSTGFTKMVTNQRESLKADQGHTH